MRKFLFRQFWLVVVEIIVALDLVGVNICRVFSKQNIRYGVACGVVLGYGVVVGLLLDNRYVLLVFGILRVFLLNLVGG